jgi:transposase
MRIIRKERAYEGLPASSAVAMAVMETSGIRALIDKSVEYDRERRLSPGMAVKAMIGPIFDGRKKLPLSGVRYFYNAAPADILFGKGVDKASLNDNALARNLDDIFDTGLDELFWKCSKLIKKRYGFDSPIKHMDSTNYSVFALPSSDEDDDRAALPAFSGHAKDKRDDLLQYAASTITDGDRIMEYCRAYSGNTADSAMDSDTLDFLKEHSDSKDIIIADCKLVNSALIRKLASMDARFVSKLPESFSNRIRNDIVYSALNSDLDPSTVEGYSVYDTVADTECGRLRFIAYRSPKGTRQATDYLRRQGGKETEKRFACFRKRRFACEEDALRSFGEVTAAHKDSAYIVKGTPVRIETLERRPTRGRPAADSPPPEMITEWRIDIDAVFDESLAAELAKRRDISVIITDLPFAAEDAGDLRDGVTADKVLRLYLDQYKVEHTYRLMKSGMGVDTVYVQTPSRANALLFVIGIATLVSSIMDAMLRKNGCRYGTVKQACRDLQYVMLEYRRDEDAISFIGCEGSGEKVFDYLDGIGLDPSTILDIYG